MGTGTARTLLEALQLPLFYVHGQQAALAAHQGGDVQRLAAGTGAGIDDAHAGADFQRGGDQLGARILLLEPAIGKGLGAEQGGVSGNLQRGGDPLDRNGGDVLLGQHGLQLFPGALEGVDPQVALGHPGQGCPLGRPGLAQLLAAQLLQPARATIHQHRVLLGLGETTAEGLFIEAIQAGMVRLGYLVEGVPAVQQRPDVLGGLTHLNAGEEAVEAEAAQQIAGDQGNPCLFLRFEFDAGEVTGIGSVQGETLSQYIVNDGNDQIPGTGQQWGLEHEINLGQIKMNRRRSGWGSETDKSAQ
ncbi:hypothetical protein D3C79_619420 [compost metagenome]